MKAYISVLIAAALLSAACSNPTKPPETKETMRIADGVDPDWVPDNSAVTSRGLNLDEYSIIPENPYDPIQYAGPSGGQEFLYFHSPNANRIIKKVKLGDETNVVMEHAWSNDPANPSLVYTIYDKNSRRYKLMRLDELDGEPVQIYEDSSPIQCLSWTWDNSRVAFRYPHMGYGILEPGMAGITLINADGGGGPENLANDRGWGWPDQFDFIRCAADGPYLIYITRYRMEESENIFRIDLTGGEPANLTGLADSTKSIIAAEASPDGKVIAFIMSDSESGYQLVYLKRMPDGEPVRVISTTFNTFPPDTRLCENLAWSPDGKRIAVGTRFPLVIGNDQLEIYIVSLSDYLD